MNIWKEIIIGIIIILVVLRPVIQRKSNNRKKEALGSILLKFGTPHLSTFISQIFFGLVFIALACMSFNQYLKYTSTPYFEGTFVFGAALLALVMAVMYITDGIMQNHDVEFREKGIYSEKLVLRWEDVDYYYWSKNQINFKLTTKIAFFKYISFEKLRINSEQISNIDEVLKQFITEKP